MDQRNIILLVVLGIATTYSLGAGIITGNFHLTPDNTITWPPEAVKIIAPDVVNIGERVSVSIEFTTPNNEGLFDNYLRISPNIEAKHAFNCQRRCLQPAMAGGTVELKTPLVFKKAGEYTLTVLDRYSDERVTRTIRVR
ncbi:MAG: hypothetical protein AABW49_01000 [Nanoarchaeota archaeon]